MLTNSVLLDVRLRVWEILKQGIGATFVMPDSRSELEVGAYVVKWFEMRTLVDETAGGEIEK
eukprot:4842217-Pleurochrysis_carterae.AAC.2